MFSTLPVRAAMLSTSKGLVSSRLIVSTGNSSALFRNFSGHANSSIGINSNKNVSLNVRLFSSGRTNYNKEPSKSQISPSTADDVQLKVKKQKRFSFFKAIWRVSYISAIAGLGYLGYSIYSTRCPPDQVAPDPNKKNLVILGTGWGSVSLLKTIDSENYNVTIISPRNFFLFTPLLPSCPTGTIEHRSIMEPVRGIIRQKKTSVRFLEAEATDIDPTNKKITIKGSNTATESPAETLNYDYLVIGVGAQNSTFGIPGIKENACFLKEIDDSVQVRKKFMDCIEAALLKPKGDPERKTLLSMVVVGGGPTGVEFAGELQDFFDQDLRKTIPEIADEFQVTLIEALPNVLPSFNQKLIAYTEKIFKQEKIDVRTKTMVSKVTDKTVFAKRTNPDGSTTIDEIPYGMLVWATGNAPRDVVRDLISKLPEQNNSRRGLLVNDFLVVKGADNIWSLGDCSSTKYAPTAQVAAQQGVYLAKLLNKVANADTLESEIHNLQHLAQDNKSENERKIILNEVEVKSRKLRRIRQLLPFEYTHQGSLAYIGSDKAVADLVWGEFSSVSTGGTLTFLFWRSAYVSMCFSVRNKVLVVLDWLKVSMFGRDISRE